MLSIAANPGGGLHEILNYDPKQRFRREGKGGGGESYFHDSLSSQPIQVLDDVISGRTPLLEGPSPIARSLSLASQHWPCSTALSATSFTTPTAISGRLRKTTYRAQQTRPQVLRTSMIAPLTLTLSADGN
jgi:hypothetical protein